MAGLRNVLVHEYFRVDPDMIRDIVDNQLAPLLDEIG
ncbi:HepT-like ribonuclease domain-containing protein [Georgenia sp. TF02-10]